MSADLERTVRPVLDAAAIAVGADEVGNLCDGSVSTHAFNAEFFRGIVEARMSSKPCAVALECISCVGNTGKHSLPWKTDEECPHSRAGQLAIRERSFQDAIFDDFSIESPRLLARVPPSARREFHRRKLTAGVSAFPSRGLPEMRRFVPGKRHPVGSWRPAPIQRVQAAARPLAERHGCGRLQIG